MTRIISLIATLAAVGLTAPAALAVGNCDAPSAPAIYSSELSEEMLRTEGGYLRTFMADTDTYLACLTEYEETFGIGTTAEEKAASINAYNSAVGLLEQSAAIYNGKVVQFKAQQ